MISDEAYAALEEAVGADNVSRDPAVLDGYAFQTFGNVEEGHPWVSRPEAVVLPATTEEVQEVVRACGRYGLKFKAHSTGWGAHASPAVENVVQIDLRRMNRIVEIDTKNMYVVLEPYVICAQVQAEVMKRGLNLHIVGAGCSTSPLASCTSMDGTGWTGLSTGYNCRNVLGVEWVLPNGELVRLGTLGSDAGWFCGDGPGPSLRGIMRGLFGARSGLGVFTRMAVKLYNWPGPPEPDIHGTLFDITGEVPENFRTYLCVFPSFEAYAQAAYDIGDAEIGFMLCKNAIGLMLAIFMPRMLKKLTGAENLKTAINSMEHMFQFMIGANSPEEFDYQEEVLRRVMDKNEGVLIDIAKLPLHPSVWWGFVRGAMPPLSFRAGGTMGTSFGTVECFGNAVNQSKRGAALKRKYIDKGGLIEDLADNAWGGIYESTGLYGHQEELILFDPRNPDHIQGVRDYEKEAAEMTRDEHFGVGLGVMAFDAAFRDSIFGPDAHNYQLWQQRIKAALDPNDVADSTFYV